MLLVRELSYNSSNVLNAVLTDIQKPYEYIAKGAFHNSQERSKEANLQSVKDVAREWTALHVFDARQPFIRGTFHLYLSLERSTFRRLGARGCH